MDEAVKSGTMMNALLKQDIVQKLISESGIASFSRASIREVARLVTQIEEASGIKFIRMEMGEPGLPCISIAVEAEIEALKNGVASTYPNIEGIKPLKQETSRFIKLFLDIDMKPQGCIPTVGSMMGAMAAFLVANRNDRTKEGSLFLDPGFPVQKQQVKMLGHDYYSFDIFEHRGKKLKSKLESFLKTRENIIYSVLESEQSYMDVPYRRRAGGYRSTGKKV